jgi:hypothetical protein
MGEHASATLTASDGRAPSDDTGKTTSLAEGGRESEKRHGESEERLRGDNNKGNNNRGNNGATSTHGAKESFHVMAAAILHLACAGTSGPRVQKQYEQKCARECAREEEKAE